MSSSIVKAGNGMELTVILQLLRFSRNLGFSLISLSLSLLYSSVLLSELLELGDRERLTDNNSTILNCEYPLETEEANSTPTTSTAIQNQAWFVVLKVVVQRKNDYENNEIFHVFMFQIYFVLIFCLKTLKFKSLFSLSLYNDFSNTIT